MRDEGLSLTTIADLTAERIRRVAAALRTKRGDSKVDLGFRKYHLSNSNIRAWDPKPSNLEKTLFDSVEHVLKERNETDLLSELLLKLGLDMCVPVSARTIAGREIYSVADGVLIACLVPSIDSDDVEALAAGIVEWHRELSPHVSTTCVFLDNAFSDDVAKVNLTAILQQHGIKNVRSL